MPRPSILITGGAGFIGRRVAALLLARQCRVTIVDDLSTGVAMPSTCANLTLHRQDIRDHVAMRRIFAAALPDAVIHLAALHHIPTCEREPERAHSINIDGTHTILEIAASQGVTQFILASSAAVYDWMEEPLSEDDTPLRASDVYSATKLENECQVAAWAVRQGGRASIARIFNTIGHDDPNSHLIPDIIAQLAGGNRIIRLGNTAPKRDYTHADDIAAGIVALLDHPPASGIAETYNLSYGTEHSVTELVAAVGIWLGYPLSVHTDPARVRATDRPHLLGDPRKTYRLTGWYAQLDLARSLNRILPHLLPDTLRCAS